ncbi:hypothetical protein H920_19405 [Fukomys damarensis]|uniref:Uncharacterized protein n=1 Tax=Fukomys damarensis TaxID=885580 RepID=A0A091D8U0_FUKDA|nr:hypothetical protein H920_19405 [Fukomys damarensis]
MPPAQKNDQVVPEKASLELRSRLLRAEPRAKQSSGKISQIQTSNVVHRAAKDSSIKPHRVAAQEAKAMFSNRTIPKLRHTVTRKGICILLERRLREREHCLGQGVKTERNQQCGIGSLEAREVSKADSHRFLTEFQQRVARRQEQTWSEQNGATDIWVIKTAIIMIIPQCETSTTIYRHGKPKASKSLQ